MDAASAVYIQRVLQSKWGLQPCSHPSLERIQSVRGDLHGWLCMVCGCDFEADYQEAPAGHQERHART